MKNKKLFSKAIGIGFILFAANAANAGDANAPHLLCQFGDDNLGGPCCDSSEPRLPDFQKAFSKGSYACIDKCKEINDFQVRVEVSKLAWFACDMARVKVSVNPLGLGGPTFSGKLIAKYSRTWILEETGQQVWRFLLNGDMKYQPALGVFGCPQPPHSGPSHFTGHIDYTCNPLTPDASPTIALNLNHLPGCISHGPLSARPLSGVAAHENISYHLVTPSGFNWLAATALEGPTPAEAVRPGYEGDCFPNTFRCLNEVPVREGEIKTAYRDCLCLDGSQGNWNHQKMYGRGECNGDSLYYETVNGFDPSIPVGMVTLPLGNWTGNHWMDGVELSIHQGYFKLQNPCPTVSPADDYERFHGATTAGLAGRTFQDSEFNRFKVWMDLQNHKLPRPDQQPLCIDLENGFGSPAYSTVVWNLNILP